MTMFKIRIRNNLSNSVPKNKRKLSKIKRLEKENKKLQLRILKLKDDLSKYKSFNDSFNKPAKASVLPPRSSK